MVNSPDYTLGQNKSGYNLEDSSTIEAQCTLQAFCC